MCDLYFFLAEIVLLWLGVIYSKYYFSEGWVWGGCCYEETAYSIVSFLPSGSCPIPFCWCRCHISWPCAQSFSNISESLKLKRLEREWAFYEISWLPCIANLFLTLFLLFMFWIWSILLPINVFLRREGRKTPGVVDYSKTRVPEIWLSFTAFHWLID